MAHLAPGFPKFCGLLIGISLVEAIPPRERSAASAEAVVAQSSSKGPVMRKLFLVGALLGAMLIPTASASAALEGEYARFKTCPLANVNVKACVYAESTSGTFTMGAKTVPIVNPVVLKGGTEFLSSEGLFGPLNFVAPTDGQTLSKAPQPGP